MDLHKERSDLHLIAQPMILIDRGWKAELESGSNFQFGSLYAEIMTLQVHSDLTLRLRTSNVPYPNLLIDFFFNAYANPL